MGARQEPADQRKRELAMIHVAKKDLGMDDETYRQMLWTIARVKSAADLDSAGRKQVIDHLKGCGFRVKRKRSVRPGGSRAPLLAKIRALLGKNRGDEYALGILANMHGKEAAPDRLEWASPEQLRKVVAALNYDAKRRKEAK